MNSKGFVAIGLLVLIIALMALIGIAIAKGSNMFNKATAINNTITQLVAQANLIRQKIVQCATEYPEGDNGTSYHKPYPSGSGVLVSTLTCPGAPAGGNNLWSGIDGVFLPQTPTGFNSWVYTNDATSVRISIQTTNTAAYSTAMQQAAAKFTSSEASVSGNTLTFIVTN
jgi:hypothetical protein